MSSPSHYAGVITASCIVMVMRAPGGKRYILIRSQPRVPCGCKRVYSKNRLDPNWPRSKGSDFSDIGIAHYTFHTFLGYRARSAIAARADASQKLRELGCKSKVVP